MNKYKFPVVIVVGIVILAVAGVFAVTKADVGAITACIRKDGLVHFIGNGFKRGDCKKNEQLLTWNVQGPKGDVGPIGPMGPQGLRGEPGLPAPQGAGDIAFYFKDSNSLRILKNDGTVWFLNGSNWSYLASQGGSWANINPSMPLTNIVKWSLYEILDINGDVWFYKEGVWINLGNP